MPTDRSRSVVRRRTRLPPVAQELAVTAHPLREPGAATSPERSQPVGRASEPVPAALAAAIAARRGGGRRLPARDLESLQAGIGRPLDAVRIHDGPDAAALAESVGALAFTVGPDVFLGRGLAPEDPAGRRLLAHELAHAVLPAPEPDGPGLWTVTDDAVEAEADRLAEQATTGRVDPDHPPVPERATTTARADAEVLLRYPDPTRTALTSPVVVAMTDADLVSAVADLRRGFTAAGPEAATTPLMWDNLSLLLSRLQARHVAVGDDEAPTVAGTPADLAAPGQIAALDVHLEAIDAAVARQMGTAATTVRARIARRRGWLATMHRDAVVPEGARVEALGVALRTWQETKQVVPARAATDARISGPEQNLRRALAFCAATLLSSAQADGVVALELARTDYLAAFARLLLTTANDLRTQLREPRLRDIPMVSLYREGINTRTPGGPWPGADDLREYLASLDRLVAALDAHGDLASRAAADPVSRLAYLTEHGDMLMDQVGQVQALLVAGQGIALVSYFQHATSSQLRTFDWARINAMREQIIEPMIAGLRNERAPDAAAIESAQFHLETASPEPTDKEGNPDPAAIAEQRRRHRERRAARGASGDEPEDPTRRRLREVAEFERSFGIFVGVAASIIGAVAAAGAVGAVMRTALFSEGGALAAGQGLRIGAIRFAVQSLTFTFASQTMHAALHGRLPAPGDVAKAAAMDALTLGFMHGIGLPFTKVGQQPPTVVQFTALWAWSSAWQVGALAWRGQLTLGSAARAVAMAGVETALMLKALEVAHRVGMLPTPDGLGHWFRPRTVEQARALQEYLAAQREGRAVREDAVLWERGERLPAGLDAILQGSQRFMGRYRRALEGMRTSGLLAPAEIEPIIARAAAQANEILTLRDAMWLGLSPGGPGMVRYAGTTGNLMVYLERLRLQGTVSRAVAVGRGGVFEVTYADGSVRFFYPQGPAGGASAAGARDFMLESVQRALPEAQGAHHLLVLESLRRLPPDAAARLTAAAETSPRARAVLDFVARPDVAIELSRPGSLYGERLLTDALSGEVSAVAVLNRPESPLVLQRWFATRFEQLNPTDGRSAARFLSFLDQVRLYRGTLEVSSLGEAQAVATALAEASTVGYFRATRTTPGPSISAPGRSAPTAPAPSAIDFFLRQGLTEGMRSFRADGLDWYVSLDAGGRPLRAWGFVPGTDRPAREVDVAGTLDRLRAGLAQVDTFGAGQDAAARRVIDALTPQAEALAFLRRMRGFDIARDLAVLDRVQLDPRGSAPRTPPPTVDVPGPLAPPQVGPGVVFQPVTPSEILSQRQRGLHTRAGRMGQLADATVQRGLTAQIRTPLTLQEQVAVRTALETAERHLDRLAETTYAEVSGRLGPARFRPVLSRVFPGRTRLQVGEALRFMVERPGYTDAALEALARLPAGSRAVLGQLEPALLAALGEVAATSPAAAQRLLDNRGRLLLDLQHDPVMAARFIELAHMLQGGQLPFTDPHRHLFGGILYPELLVRSMVDATSLTLPGGAPAPRLVRARLEALAAAERRLLRAGDTIADRLPPGHPGTVAYETHWQTARPLVESYAGVLRESIQRGQCLVEQGPLEAQLTEALTRAFTLPAETAARGPQGDIFFVLFGALSRAAPRRGAVPAFTALATGQRLAYVELRAGRDQSVLDQLRAQDLVGADGQPLPDLRLVITVPRYVRGDGGSRVPFDPAEVQQQLSGLGPLRSRVVGVDVSGVESGALPAGAVLTLNATLARGNFTALETMFGAHPALLAEVTTRLGQDPVAAGRALVTQIEVGTTPAAGAAHPVAVLARLNRRVQEVVSELDARDRTVRLPDTLMDLTIHAGEQVRSDARIDMLLRDVQTSLDAGTARIGHGIVLGFPLPYGLAQLGFTRHPDGSWSRPRAQGPPEAYTAAELVQLERLRLDLIRRAGDENVTLEISPTSNLVLAGLPTAAHPIRELLQTRPNLRIAIATDNPGLHLVDPAGELAVASAVSGASYPQIVRIYLEGFSSRLGSRAIGNAPTVREQALQALTAAVPPAERAYVLRELQARFGIDAGVTTSAPVDAVTFEARLRPYLERVIR